MLLREGHGQPEFSVHLCHAIVLPAMQMVLSLVWHRQEARLVIGQRFPGSCEGSFAISRLSGRSALSLRRDAACSCAVRRLVPAAACGSFKPLTTAPALFSVMCAASTAAFLCATFLLFFCGSFRSPPATSPCFCGGVWILSLP